MFTEKDAFKYIKQHRPKKNFANLSKIWGWSYVKTRWWIKKWLDERKLAISSDNRLIPISDDPQAETMKLALQLLQQYELLTQILKEQQSTNQLLKEFLKKIDLN